VIDDKPIGAPLNRDIARGEATEKELDRLIERRSRQKYRDEESELWKASVRRYNARRRKELDLQRYEYHCGQAVRLKAVLGSLIREHQRNAEKYLPKGA
jgi:hypothetical protein